MDVNPIEVYPIEAYPIGEGAVEVSGWSLHMNNRLKQPTNQPTS